MLALLSTLLDVSLVLGESGVQPSDTLAFELWSGVDDTLAVNVGSAGLPWRGNCTRGRATLLGAQMWYRSPSNASSASSLTELIGCSSGGLSACSWDAFRTRTRPFVVDSKEWRTECSAV